jgi:hypothetical protein
MRLGLAALLLLAAAAAEAALPAPPFDLAVSSTSLREGDTVTVRVSPRSAGAAQDRYDLYVLLASSEEAAFLTPEGRWAPRPVAYARAVSTSNPPLVREWPRVWPAGQHALALMAVAPAGDPLDRASWQFRPAIVWLRITPLNPDRGAPMVWTWLLLGAAALAAVALVWWAGTRPASASAP